MNDIAHQYLGNLFCATGYATTRLLSFTGNDRKLLALDFELLKP